MRNSIRIAIMMLGMAWVPFHVQGKTIEYGIKAGLDVANTNYSGYSNINSPLDGEALNFNPGQTLKSRTGFIGGAFAALPLNKRFSLQSELLFIQRGWNSTQKYGSSWNNAPGSGGAGFWDFFSGELIRNTLELPVLLKYAFILKGPVTPRLYAGPSIAYLLSEKHKYSDLENGLESPQETDVTNGVKTTFNMNFGLETSFGRFLLDIRYGLGLSDVIKDPLGLGYKAKDGLLCIMGGYKF